MQTKNLLTPEQEAQLNYDGEMTLEALAALEVYTRECCNTAATSRRLHKKYNAVKRLLSHPYVRELFKLKLMQKGVTPDKIAETIGRGLDATNGVYYEGAKVAEEPNWAAQQRCAQLAAEIYEVLKYQNKNEDNSINVHQHLNVNFNKIEGEKLVAEAKRRGIKVPEILARRFDTATRDK